MLKFTSIVGYTSCGPTYIESFFTIFGQCINVLNYKTRWLHAARLSIIARELRNKMPLTILTQNECAVYIFHRLRFFIV